MFAAEIRKGQVDYMRQHTRWKWHLDEIYVKINGEMHYLWRAVDHEGEVLESFVAQGPRRVAELLDDVRRNEGAALPDLAWSALLMLTDQLSALVGQDLPARSPAAGRHRQSQTSQRLATIPGVGIITATAPAASITDQVCSARAASSRPSWAWSRV